MRFVIETLRNWWNSRRGTRRSAAGIQLRHQSRRVPIPRIYRDEATGLPVGLPSPTELRILAAHLAESLPAVEALDLARRKEYPLIHELAGYHDALDSIRGIADTLEQAELEAQGAESDSL